MVKEDSKNDDKFMEKIVSFAKRRGFIFQSSEIYGGINSIYDYGPLGMLLKNNLKKAWFKEMIQLNDNVVGLDSGILMHPKIWEASGHIAGFSDPLVDCKSCKKRFRADHLLEASGLKPDFRPKEFKKHNLKCPECDGELTDVREFNLMFKTFMGAVEDSTSEIYMRPETAQGIYVNFQNVSNSMRLKIPFGIAQIGKAFRNEITPRDFIFRVREFEQMEIEYFVRAETWEKYFEYWKDEMLSWMEEVGIDMSKVHELEVEDVDRAHYSKRTVDFEFDYPFGRKELFGLAYRTDFDLKNHKLNYIDEENTDLPVGKAEKMIPHVIEPTFGVDRAVLALLLSSYCEEEKGEEIRSYLKFKPNIAPVICAVSPLLKNKIELIEYANIKVFAPLKAEFGRVMWDDNGNIGKRYRRQDEIGTPFCIVVDFETLENDTVTVRDRDTGEQERVKVEDLKKYIQDKIS